MVNSSTEFWNEAKPIADLLSTVNTGFHRTYERPDSNEYFDKKERGWSESLEIERVQSDWDLQVLRPYKKTFRDHVLYQVLARAYRNRDRLLSNMAHESYLDEPYDMSTHHNYDESTDPKSLYDAGNASGRIDEAYRQLSNAWRNEYAVCEPFNSSAQERMKTAEWRLIKCYYAVKQAVTAMMCGRFNKDGDYSLFSHSGVLNWHANHYIKRLGSDLYHYPFMSFGPDVCASNPESRREKVFDWTLHYPGYNVDPSKEISADINAGQKVTADIFSSAKAAFGSDTTPHTFYDVLLNLRMWANYEHGAVFSRLFGDGLAKRIDDALQLIAYTGLVIAEVGLIFTHGFAPFKQHAEEYCESCDAGVSDAKLLIERRLGLYEKILDKIDPKTLN